MNKISIDRAVEIVRGLEPEKKLVNGVFQEVVSTTQVRKALNREFPGLLPDEFRSCKSIRRTLIDGCDRFNWCLKKYVIEDIVHYVSAFNSKIDSSDNCLVQKELDLNADSYEKMKIELLKRIADGIEALNSKWGN